MVCEDLEDNTIFLCVGSIPFSADHHPRIIALESLNAFCEKMSLVYSAHASSFDAFCLTQIPPCTCFAEIVVASFSLVCIAGSTLTRHFSWRKGKSQPNSIQPQTCIPRLPSNTMNFLERCQCALNCSKGALNAYLARKGLAHDALFSCSAKLYSCLWLHPLDFMLVHKIECRAFGSVCPRLACLC